MVQRNSLISGAYGEASLRSGGRVVQLSEDTVLIYSVNTQREAARPTSAHTSSLLAVGFVGYVGLGAGWKEET